jgi:FAD-dependent urate hydroxylase
VEKAVIIGAGPQGLAVAAGLRHAGVRPLVFGETMAFWTRHMPAGMLLRSSKRTSSIAHPERKRRLESYEVERGTTLAEPIPIGDFVDYGRWFQQNEVPEVEQERIASVTPTRGGFRLTTARGDELAARHVVVAAGMEPFSWRPPEFAQLPSERVSHPFDHADLSGFAGRTVLVVGAGQSALESAALLVEAGAEVEIVVRKGYVTWIAERGEKTTKLSRLVHKILYPPIDVGSRGSAWVAAAPDVFRWLPGGMRAGIAYDILQPMGAAWLVKRLEDVPILTGRTIRSAAGQNGGLRVELDDGSARKADHLLLATGYRVDVRRYAFLSPELLEELRVSEGYPQLGVGLESSVPGLYFVGAAAARTFGPVMRFVTGSWFAAPAVTRSVLGKPPAPVIFSF